MSDFAFLEEPAPVRSRQQHTEDVRRESFKHALKTLANDAERAVEYCRDLMRSGADVSDELDELETTARGLLLVALLLRRESKSC